MTKLNSILWHRDVTPKTKTHICHALVNSTITYAAETFCIKIKTLAKLNSTEMDFGDARLQFPGRTKLGILLFKKKMNVARSLLDDIKTKQLQLYGHVQRMEERDYQKKL